MKRIVLTLLNLSVTGFTANNVNSFFHEEEPLLVKPQVEVVPYSWNDELVENVMFFEGFYSRPYTCPGGKRTIGFGHTGEYSKLNFVSRDKARNILLEELREHRKKVLTIVEVPLTENQIAALTSFTFNCGEGSLRKLVSGPNRLNSGNYESVSKILPLYRKANGKVLKGLENRRTWEKELWEHEEIFVVINSTESIEK